MQRTRRIFSTLTMTGIAMSCGGKDVSPLSGPQGENREGGTYIAEGDGASTRTSDARDSVDGPASRVVEARDAASTGDEVKRESQAPSRTSLPASARCSATSKVIFSDERVATAVRAQAGVSGVDLQLEDVSTLRNLTVGEPGVASLVGLECLTNLQTLRIDHGAFQDLSPLMGLPLRALTLAGGQLVDISQLAALKDLDWLYLDSNHIADIAPLAQLSKLYNLSLPNNQIRDVRPLLALEVLDELILELNPVDCGNPDQRSALEQLKVRVLQSRPPPPERLQLQFFIAPCP